MQHDLWHKLRTRERLDAAGVGSRRIRRRRDRVHDLLVHDGLIFWKVIFGELIIGLWEGSLGSKVLLFLLGAFLVGPVIRGPAQPAPGPGCGGWAACVRAIRFRLETTWRVEAAELIDELPAFDDLPEDVLSDLAGRVRLRILRAGEPVFRQGDRSRRVLRRPHGHRADRGRGSRRSGDTRVLRTMSRGESFGEMGLLGSHRRQATVRAHGRGRALRGGQGDVRSTARRGHACAGLRPHDAGPGGAARAPGLPLPSTRSSSR